MKYLVTIEQRIITEIEVEAPSAESARADVEKYGPGQYAMDAGRNDVKTDRIMSVRRKL